MRRKQFFWRLVILSVVCSVYHCRKKPGDYIRKAREALEREDTSKAAFYFQKGYELSLSDHFFLLSRDAHFSHMEASSNRRHLILVQSSKKKSDFVYKAFHRDGDSEEIWESVEGEIKHSSISSNGKYILFVVSQLVLGAQAQVCKLVIWKVPKNKFIEISPNLNCGDRPAVSSKGEVLFMKKNQVWSWGGGGSSVSSEKINLWTSKTPDKPLKNQRVKASFSFSKQGSPFMTYGTAGIYKLYSLANHNLRLITKNASYYKIFFTSQNQNLGVITGGASQQKFTFFHPQYQNKVVKGFKIPVLKDISFVNENEYYSIESNRLHQTKRGEVTALPFFAKNILVDYKGGVFFLSLIGTLLHYQGILPNKLSQNIFTKTLDIEESR